MNKLSAQKRYRVHSKYRAEMEDTSKLTFSLNKMEKAYQRKIMREKEEMDKKLEDIKEMYKPINYNELRSFSVAYESKRIMHDMENQEKRKREKSKNKNILPILNSYNKMMKESIKGDFFMKKEDATRKLSKIKGYSTYVKKHFLPPVKRAETIEDSDTKRLGYSVKKWNNESSFPRITKTVRYLFQFKLKII